MDVYLTFSLVKKELNTNFKDNNNDRTNSRIDIFKIK